MRLNKSLIVTALMALLSCLGNSSYSDACWHRAEHRCCQLTNRCRHTECVECAVGEYMGHSCPTGYTWANCPSGTWVAVDPSQPGFCVNTDTILGQSCHQIGLPKDTAKDDGLRFRMVCDKSRCVWRLARPFERADAYLPFSARGEPCP
jgi:hypothetical protein